MLCERRQSINTVISKYLQDFDGYFRDLLLKSLTGSHLLLNVSAEEG